MERPKTEVKDNFQAGNDKVRVDNKTIENRFTHTQLQARRDSVTMLLRSQQQHLHLPLRLSEFIFFEHNNIISITPDPTRFAFALQPL